MSSKYSTPVCVHFVCPELDKYMHLFTSCLLFLKDHFFLHFWWFFYVYVTNIIYSSKYQNKIILSSYQYTIKPRWESDPLSHECPPLWNANCPVQKLSEDRVLAFCAWISGITDHLVTSCADVLWAHHTQLPDHHLLKSSLTSIPCLPDFWHGLIFHDATPLLLDNTACGDLQITIEDWRLFQARSRGYFAIKFHLKVSPKFKICT